MVSTSLSVKVLMYYIVLICYNQKFNSLKSGKSSESRVLIIACPTSFVLTLKDPSGSFLSQTFATNHPQCLEVSREEVSVPCSMQPADKEKAEWGFWVAVTLTWGDRDNVQFYIWRFPTQRKHNDSTALLSRPYELNILRRCTCGEYFREGVIN